MAGSQQDWDLAQSAPVVILGVWTMQCPQCGAETPDEEWNCVSCRMNVYWASQHYEDLAGIRQRQGLRTSADTPSFLLHAHVCAMADNAEANIAHARHSILGQEPTAKRIREVIVVASGCKDRTSAIVADIASREPRVHLIEQARREGKASAINLFISAAQCPVLVMVSADVMVEDGAFDALLRHFENPAVGMVGGHPTPVNGHGTFLGHAVHLQWRLHDRIAR